MDKKEVEEKMEILQSAHPPAALHSSLSFLDHSDSSMKKRALERLSTFIPLPCQDPNIPAIVH
jgi:hypothetical protein